MKLKKFARVYAVVSQGIIMMVILAFLGYGLGRLIDNTSYTYAGIFASIGILFGTIGCVILIIKTGGGSDRKTK